VGDDPGPAVSPDHGKVPFACRPGSSSLSARRRQVRMCNARTAMQVTHVLSFLKVEFELEQKIFVERIRSFKSILTVQQTCQF
jgi:hypothetical protein